MKISKLFLAMGCIAFSSGAASAVTLYSNIGSGFPADSLSNYATEQTFIGTTFTATTTGNLATLESRRGIIGVSRYSWSVHQLGG